MESKPETLIRLAEVRRRTGLSRSSIYAAIAAGDFPKPVNIGVRSVAWPESAVQRWITAKISTAQKFETETVSVTGT